MSDQLVVKRKRGEGPFFNIGGRWYLDVLYNFGEALTVDFADVMRVLVEVPSDSVLVGRRLSAEELELFKRDRRDADDDTYARLMGTDEERWSKK